MAVARYFKTGKGEYGEGDVFWGISVPDVRKVARLHLDASRDAVVSLLRDPVHEVRLCGLCILVLQFQKGDGAEREQIVSLYLSHTKAINNWDLVDLSCHAILGEYLVPRDRTILETLARSTNLWERRIAIISTFAFLRHGECADTIRLATLLKDDPHDLMHKAVGWALREVGKRDKEAEVRFLTRYAETLPRTTLRYAIEKFSPKEREYWLTLGSKKNTAGYPVRRFRQQSLRRR